MEHMLRGCSDKHLTDYEKQEICCNYTKNVGQFHWVWYSPETGCAYTGYQNIHV